MGLRTYDGARTYRLHGARTYRSDGARTYRSDSVRTYNSGGHKGERSLPRFCQNIQKFLTKESENDLKPFALPHIFILAPPKY